MDMPSRIGDYEVLGEIGQGGMGRVYRVRNVISERIEAMKVLLPDLAGRRDLAARFLREIKLLAALDHPHIAPLRTALEVDNQLIMIMEFVDGQSVAARLTSGSLPIDAAISCVDDVLDALDYAHGHGVVHRDIKPANMMLTPQGVVKLMDFGIARSSDDQTLTIAGTTTGSLLYMSPEQVHGKDTDARSDLYSLGISLYQMVTGQLPFEADSDIAVMVAHLQRMPKPPIELQPALSPKLNDIILKSIAKDPADRFQSAREFREALRTLQLPEIAHSVSVPSRAPAIAMLAPTLLNTPRPVEVAQNRTTPAPTTPSTAGAIMNQKPLPQASAKQGTQNRVAYVLIAGVLAFAVAGAVMYSRRAETSPPADNAAQPVMAIPQTPVETAPPVSDTAVSPAPTGPGANDANGTSTGGVPAIAPPPPPAAAASSAPSAGSPGAPPSSAPPSALSTARPAAGAPAVTSAGGSSNSAPAGGAAPSAPPAALAPMAPLLPLSPSSPAGRAPAQAAAPAATVAPAVNWDQVEDEVDQLAARAVSINGSLDRMQQQQARAGLSLRGDVAARQESMNTSIVRVREAVRDRNATRTPRLVQTATADVEFLEKFLGR